VLSIRSFALVSGLLLLPAVAAAQGQTGSVVGEIVDQDGLPLDGVQVVVRSPTQIGGDRVTRTDRNGRFRFINLTPGTFELRASKTGLNPIVKRNIEVHLGGSVELFEIMEIPTAQEEIVVTAPPSAVDVNESTVGQTVPDDLLQSIPSEGRGFQSVAATVPGVQGGGNPNIRGGASFNNTYVVDGVSVTDPVTHTFGTNFNFDTMSDTEVMTAGYGAEYATTMGGVINLVTISGSNDLHVDASFFHTNDALVAPVVDGGSNQFNDTSYNLNVNGPILRDRLWYLASIQRDNRVSSIPGDPTGRFPDHPPRHFEGWRYMGKLNWQARDSTQVIGVIQGAPASIDNSRQLLTVEPEAERHQDQDTQVYSLEARQNLGENLLWRTQVYYHRVLLDVFPQSGDFDTPGYEADRTTALESFNAIRIIHDARNTIGLNTDMTHFLGRFGGEHALRYGAKFTHSWNPNTTEIPGGLTFRNDNGEPFARTQWCVDFDPETLQCTQGVLDVTSSGETLLLFLQDGFSPRMYDRLTLTPGVGIEYGHSENFAGDAVTDFLTATPHLNLTWRPTGDNRTVVRAGYNQYVDVGFLALPGFVGKDFFQRTCEIDAAAQEAGAADPYLANCVNSGGEQGVTVGRPNGVADGGDTTNPDALDAPRMHELYVGAERDVWRGLAVGTDVVYREYVHQFEDIETNIVWNENGSNVDSFRNGESEFVFDLETPESAHRTNFTWTLFARRYVGRFNLLGSYTYARSFGTVPEPDPASGQQNFASIYLDNYEQAKFAYGPLPDDIRHSIKLYGSYLFFGSFSVGGSAVVNTGAPYDFYVFNNLYRSFQDRRAPRGQSPGESLSTTSDDEEQRFATQLELGLKLDYNFLKLTGVNGDVILEVFNVLNSQEVTRIEQRDVLTNGSVLDRQDPLRARLGLRIRY